ncbi:MAG TPA: ATP-binding protein [Candidatus Deferrimicrobiaceae bacterium]
MGNAIPFPSNVRKGAGIPSRGLPLSAVPRIARICALGLGFDELLDEVCREILALSGADGGCLFFCGDEWVPERGLRAGAAGDPPDATAAYRPGPPLDAILDRLRAEGVLRADDIELLPPEDPLKLLLSDLPVRSALLVPLRFGTRLLGFLALHATGNPRPWTGELLSAMDLVATILSAVLERRRMEDRLRVSEARYRFLAESSPDLISLHEPSGRFLYASPASLQILGVRPERMAGAPVEGFLHPDDVAAVLEEFRRVLSGGGASTLLYRMRRADGAFLEVESSSTAIPGGPRDEPRVIRVTRDVTARRRMEARLQENQTLSAIGTLAGGVAHEFNNLMAGIQGAVEMLSLVAGENPQARPYLDVILRMGNRATELTHQLLAYSRQGKYSPVVLSLRTVVNETVSVLRASLPPAVELAVSIEEGLPPVYADAAQMRQVVTGLCLNAAEAMPEGGRIAVRAGREPEGRRVVLQVSDTGIGMGEETRSRIFQPFFSTKSAGRGMGLAAIRGIVENHGGEVLVDSRPGEGATFSVLLPASAERRKATRHPATGPRPDTGRILLADDEPDVRAVVRAMLESLGYTVVEAKDGREAVDLFRRGHAGIDMVLLDQLMPRLTGEAALAEMRKIAPGVRAILASGYDESDRVGEIVAAGFGGFLQKPFRRQELGEMIAGILAAPGPRGE